MTDLADAPALAAALVRCRSITPDESGALDLAQNWLTELGFVCERMRFSEPGAGEVDNLYARLGRSAPHLCFAGHTDVVPAGEEKNWTHPPFAARIEKGVLYGRGASDMKGAIAAFIAAAAGFVRDSPDFPDLTGSLGVLLTGDEEGAAVNGTKKMLAALAARGEEIDDCLVGEPSNPSRLGEEIKTGRRGSLNALLEVQGQEGHVAWPQRAANPLPVLAKLLSALAALELDQGSARFAPSQLVITSIDTGNPARNVIPRRACAAFNIRFNDQHDFAGLEKTLTGLVQSLAAGTGVEAKLDFTRSAQVFWQKPGALAELIRRAVLAETGREPIFSTSGGTSDARFIKDYARIAEFGLIGASMHKTDEHARLEDIAGLTKIYRRVLNLYFSSTARA